MKHNLQSNIKENLKIDKDQDQEVRLSNNIK